MTALGALPGVLAEDEALIQEGNEQERDRQARWKYPGDAELIAFVKNPARTVPGSKMPAWDGIIAEEDLAPLAAYVRTLGAASR